MPTDPDYDVLVLGGGPAGSTAAALLAREGRRVALLERERFPRYHVGESLLPSVLPFLEELGVADEVARHGFHKKVGQTFVWGRHRAPWVLDFRELDVYPYAYFVERAELDALLLRNAARKGAEVHEGVSVEDVLTEGDRVVGVRARRDTGEAWSPTARYVVDATGQNALLARRAGDRQYVDGLRSLAVWSYWEGAGRLPPPADEHIVTVSTETGWIWFIPMQNGRTSVGVVTSDVDELRGDSGSRAADIEAFYRRTLGRAELVGDLLAGARQVDGMHSQRDWSYCARRFTGPGFLLAGDAACFIDPILSTGVHLAMTGGYNAALVLNSALAEPEHEPAFLRYYQRSYATTYRELLTQVRHFYQMEVHRDAVFWKSRRILRVDPRLDGSLAFVFLTSGLARHVTSEAPHDLTGQSRAAFSRRLDQGGRVDYRPNARDRDLAHAARLVVTGADGSLVAFEQRGMRLRLRPAAEAPFAARPARTAFLVEIARAADGLPLGTLLVEAARPNLPAGARAVRGFAVHARPYRGRDDAGALLREAAEAAARAIHESAETALAPLEDDVRAALASSDGTAWDLAEPAPLGDEAAAATPVTAEFARAADGETLWVVVDARRAPEAQENPYWRGRLVDASYTSEVERDPPPADVGALMAEVTAALAAAEAPCATVSEALERAPAALARGGGGAWVLRGVRRIALAGEALHTGDPMAPPEARPSPPRRREDDEASGP